MLAFPLSESIRIHAIIISRVGKFNFDYRLIRSGSALLLIDQALGAFHTEFSFGRVPCTALRALNLERAGAFDTKFGDVRIIGMTFGALHDRPPGKARHKKALQIIIIRLESHVSIIASTEPQQLTAPMK